MLYSLLFFSFSILTRYITARYLNHHFKLTIVKYIVWLLLQCVIIAFSSTLHTFICSFILFPIIGLINWLVLFRDHRNLSQALKSHLDETSSHNKEEYREELGGYRLYNVFKKVLLFSLLLLVIAFGLVKLNYFFVLIDDSRALAKIFGINLLNEKPRYQYPSEGKRGMEEFVIKITQLIYLFYTLSIVIPSFAMTVFPIFYECVKRYRSRNYTYRYNNDSFAK
ncbi:hypothetical protein LOD99_13118 [Oopsacas minuta]|uniref:Uncharacterized protein n=1 Tax=Oopsacas minuta TaxID=111878 RepID=A0AAV7JAX0_9METZ|nr:hypothetical protein LOD99_13118 [Oopsacas minuta]